MPKIEKLYAYVAEDDGPENEGIVAMLQSDIWIPLVGADMARMESLKGYANLLAKKTGKKIHLLVFSVRTELELIE